jgi:2-polyprenyl-3-methyl-5-hydroxy-6-metoxy-1,4-benzoquinol methylase
VPVCHGGCRRGFAAVIRRVRLTLAAYRQTSDRGALPSKLQGGEEALRKTEKDWVALGEKEPYWGVVSHDRYRLGNLSQEAVEEFYRSGVSYVDLVFKTIRSRLDPRFAPRTALDFGCGVGRVTIPLARRCETVVGVDVSPGMISRAQERCASQSVANARFVVGGEAIERVSGTFDLVHTFIVLQHIPARRGMCMVRRLLDLLAVGGVCVLHTIYGRKDPSHPGVGASPARRARHALTRLVWGGAGPLMRGLRPRVDRSGPAPITSFEYDLNELFKVVQEAGIRHIDLEYTDHGGLYGVILFFQRVPDATYFA